MKFIPGTAAQCDLRFSFWGAVPNEPNGTVAILVHGSDRDPISMRAAFAGWAERTGTTLFLPYFPVGVPQGTGGDGYKQLRVGEIGFDELVWAMLDQFVASYDIRADRLAVFGFSGGAQFAHRLALVQPDRFSALAIGAPGNVTLLGSDDGWWPGVNDFRREFGFERDHAGLLQLPVYVTVGTEDDGRDAIRVGAHERRWRPGANDAGRTRVDRARALAENWSAHGVAVEYEVVPHSGHQLEALVPGVLRFLDRTLYPLTAEEHQA